MHLIFHRSYHCACKELLLQNPGKIPDILGLLGSESNSSSNLPTKAGVPVSYIGGGCLLTLLTVFTLLRVAMHRYRRDERCNRAAVG